MHATLGDIRTLYIERLDGEPVFGRRLLETLRSSCPIAIVDDRAAADALITASGSDHETGFVGTLTIHDHDGTERWTHRAERPHGAAGPMAYEQLVNALCAALEAPAERPV